MSITRARRFRLSVFVVSQSTNVFNRPKQNGSAAYCRKRGKDGPRHCERESPRGNRLNGTAKYGSRATFEDTRGSPRLQIAPLADQYHQQSIPMLSALSAALESFDNVGSTVVCYKGRK